MYACSGIKVDRYSYGSIFLKSQKNAVRNVKDADVLIFGNSRTMRSFSTDAIDNYFEQKGLTYVILAAEGSTYRAALATTQALNLRPKIVLINSEILYSDKVGEAFRDLIDFPDKYNTRYSFFYAAQSLQKWACNSDIQSLKDYYCKGRRKAQWRSARNGRLEWRLIAPTEKQELIKARNLYKAEWKNQFVRNGQKMLDRRHFKKSCPILYLINSPNSHPDMMKDMAEDLAIDSVYVPVEGLTTYDKSHLDRPNSEIWAREFVKGLDAKIDKCIESFTELEKKPFIPPTNYVTDWSAELEKKKPKPDLGTKSDFEKWRNQNGVKITNAAALTPSGSTEADEVTFAQPQGRLQKIFHNLKVEAGSTAKYNVWLWSDDEVTTRLQIVRSCSAKTPVETSSKTIKITTTPQEFEIEHNFKYAHECLLVQLFGLSGNTNTFYAWKGELTYASP